MSVTTIPERDFRGPGCTDACATVKAIVSGRFGRSELLLHDPAAHEDYGRITGGPVAKPIVWTGSLVIDRWARVAQVDGRILRLTARQWELLDYLAAHAGRVCSVGEIAAAVWDDWSATHVVRVEITRLRDKLGSVAGLIETHVGRGYLLHLAPPIESPVVPVQLTPRTRTGSWAKAHDWCVCCGRVDAAHKAHGRCYRCQLRPAGQRQHGSPCGAPPAALEVP